MAGGRRLLGSLPETGLTTILLHRLLFDGESVEAGRDRLKRQCEWLRKNFTPISLSTALNALPKGDLPKNSLLITIDDAHADIIDVIDIFRSFELPIAMFVCVGWCENASGSWEDDLLARIITTLEWYAGGEQFLDVDGGRLKLGLGPAHRRESIDQILEHRDELRPHFESLLAQLTKIASENSPRTCCNWDELIDLHAAGGVAVGSHSVSHIRLASASTGRLAYEVFESQRILKAKFGDCDVFAYPFGTPEVFSDATTNVLKSAGFRAAFLTHSDYANENTDSYLLPRIALPNRPIPQAEFRARVNGGGIALQRIRRRLGSMSNLSI